MSSLDITDKIALLKRRLTAAENLLEATALALQETAIEVRTDAIHLGEANLSLLSSSNIIGHRLQLVTSKSSDSEVVSSSSGNRVFLKPSA